MPREKSIGGWVRMNGSSGCMPDSCEVYETKEDAIEAAVSLFDDIAIDEDDRETTYLADMEQELRDTGIHYFPREAVAGADYVSVEYNPEAEPEV